MRVGWRDLEARWNHYTRQGLYLLRRSPDFPKPAEIINCGKTPVWYLSDITAYETMRPELKSNAAKLRKMAGYAKARARGPRLSA